MILSLIYLAVSVLFALIIYYFTKNDNVATEAGAGIMVLLAIVTFIIGEQGWETTEITTKIYNISGLEIQMKDKAEFNGAFLLGCGSITASNSNEIRYIFFSNEEDGKQLQTLPIKNTYLKETNDLVPQLIEKKTVSQRAANVLDKLWGREEEILQREHIGTKKTILVVPENTIKIDYNVTI